MRTGPHEAFVYCILYSIRTIEGLAPVCKGFRAYIYSQPVLCYIKLLSDQLECNVRKWLSSMSRPVLKAIATVYPVGGAHGRPGRRPAYGRV